MAHPSRTRVSPTDPDTRRSLFVSPVFDVPPQQSVHKKMKPGAAKGDPVATSDDPVVRHYTRGSRNRTPPEGGSADTCYGFSLQVARGRRRQRPTTPVMPCPTEPLTVEEISVGTLTEDMLRSAAGTQRLQDVTRLELVIDTSEMTGIEGVWTAVPSLNTLVLDRSRLVSFRDLGVGLRHLHTLSLQGSWMEDLDGIGALLGLRELHLGQNRVSDVTPLACHGRLQVLDLERNRVGDMKALEILSTLPLLYR